MISKGTTHNNGAKLAAYMETSKDGERAELWELRGFATTTIKDAFRCVEAMAGATKCEQPFFHVQVRNREGEIMTRQQFEYAADRIERMLGLTGQPRAITFHTYEHNNDQHMHVAWSRIDQDTLTAKPLPFFKERLKKVSRELELHFGLEPVTNHRESNIKYAPTKAQEEQARRLGLDIHEVRNTIRNCWDHSDNGRSFQAALEHEGFTLAQGERRDFIVIDPAGGIHALGKRILDVTAAQARKRMSDLSRDELPSVEMARALLPERTQEHASEQTKQKEKTEPVWDRDRDDRTWQDAVISAAIDKEKAERNFVEPEKRTERAGSRKKETVWPINPPAQEAVRTSPQYHFEDAARRATHDHRETAPDYLHGAVAEIRTAWIRSNNARNFASALSERNIKLAVVTEQDVTNGNIDRRYSSGYAALLPRELKQGDFVAIAENGRVYNLDKRTTGEKADHAQKFMAPLDRKEFGGVYDTVKIIEQQAQLREIERHAFRDLSAGGPKRAKDTRPTGRIAKAPASNIRQSFVAAEKAATRIIGGGKVATEVIGKTLHATADAIVSLFAPTVTPKQQHEINMTARKREAEAEATIDFQEYTAELAHQRQQQENEREAARQRDRERGGRDR